MKSRYTAYALGLVDYIIDTTDPDGGAWEADETRWRASIKEFGQTFEFTGVEILDEATEPGKSRDGEQATVTFRAGLRASGRDESFVETSSFRTRDGRWLYVSGDVDQSA